MPKPATTPTSAQSLGSPLKSVRDIMRQRGGLSALRRARFVPPLQGGKVCSAHDLGLGAVRLTPGCHIAGFQPSGQRRFMHLSPV